MRPKTKGLAVAATGTTAGLAGLLIMAMPAGAGAAPELPELSATELVEATLSAEAPEFEGTVALDNQLGLAELPGLGLADVESARIYHDGDDRTRLAMRRGQTEFTAISGPDGAWTYDSATNTATRYPHADTERHQPKDNADPAAAATAIIDRLSETSTITIDGTARVADRDAYELVLTPKPSERTLLREITVAIDAETKLPLRFAVMPNGSPDPVVSAAFTEFAVGAQPDELFEFTPPRGAEVTTAEPERTPPKSAEHPDPTGALGEFGEAFGDQLSVTGSGWDTVLTGTLPDDALRAPSDLEGHGDTDPMALLDQLGERFTDGDISGHVITTRAGTGILTDDGRFAVGAVPQQVLIEALEQQ